MGFGSTYAVRRLKYEKVDRVEQIESFRKYPNIRCVLVLTGLGKNQEEKNYSDIISVIIE